MKYQLLIVVIVDKSRWLFYFTWFIVASVGDRFSAIRYRIYDVA